MSPPLWRRPRRRPEEREAPTIPWDKLTAGQLVEVTGGTLVRCELVRGVSSQQEVRRTTESQTVSPGTPITGFIEEALDVTEGETHSPPRITVLRDDDGRLRAPEPDQGEELQVRIIEE